MTIDNETTLTHIPAVEFSTHGLSTIDTTEFLDDWKYLPPYLAPDHDEQYPHNHYASCSYCGVGDNFLLNPDKQQYSTKDSPSAGCVKLEYSRMKKGGAYPIHTAPSLKYYHNQRVNISYKDAISNFADLLLDYLKEDAQILIYACGQVDYFAIFAMQEVFRLLGVRNLTGNAEHCLNAGAVHNEILTGQEGPFVSIEQALADGNKFYILNGWNGFITHPPVFNQLTAKRGLDAVLFDVMLTETGQALQNRLSDKKIGLIKPGTDPHIALAVAYYIFEQYPDAIEYRFIDLWSNVGSFHEFKTLASSDEYRPNTVAARVAAEPEFERRIEDIIYYIGDKIVDPDVVPIIIPSVGLSQSSGVVAHCLWACVIAMLGKFGLNKNSRLLGGVLRLPGQINAESEVQGLSRKYFMGRIPMTDAAEAARRMELPDDAYAAVLNDEPIAALDYSAPSKKRQLFLFFGTQFESNMPNRQPWINKLTSENTRIVVIDPIPDPWSLANAELVIPSPPHSATPKLYQNGEWRLTLSVPQKKAASETRSDATIIYDVMAEITNRFGRDKSLSALHPQLASLHMSGYLQSRFCPPKNNAGKKTSGLKRIDGEVSRVQLFERIQQYLHGGYGPLYCSFDNAQQQPIRWEDLLEHGSVVYGGVGKHRFMLDYSNKRSPFSDIYRRERQFTFFIPTPQDMAFSQGVVLNSGRSSLSDNRRRVQFAIKSFNSGKATPIDDIPLNNPVHVSQTLSRKHELRTGDWVKLYSLNREYSVTLPVIVSNRVFGDVIYVSFHRSKAQDMRSLYINDITDNIGRCNYSSQVKLKTPQVIIEKLPYPLDCKNDNFFPQKYVDSTEIGGKSISPLWDGRERPFIVQDIIKEVDDCTTFRLIGDPVCRIAFLPGQYCVIDLTINGRRQQRAYSISSSPTKPYLLDITVKRVKNGLVSNWLADNVIVGDSLHLNKIAGDFHLQPECLPKKLLLIGAGSGVTPLMSMVRWAFDSAQNIDIDFYISAREIKDVLFASELIDIENALPNFNLWIIPTSDEYKASTDVLHGRISKELLQKISPDHLERHTYICGPEGFMTAANDILLELGQHPDTIFRESFGVAKQGPVETTQGELSVAFTGTDIKVVADGSRTLLELAEENGVPINSACRSGMCGACLVKVSGATCQTQTDQLGADQIADGYRLACICYPQEDCVVDSA